MNNFDSIKNIIKKHKDELQNEYSVEKIGLFGSYVKGLERSDSDLDILIEFSKPVGMINRYTFSSGKNKKYIE